MIGILEDTGNEKKQDKNRQEDRQMKTLTGEEQKLPEQLAKQIRRIQEKTALEELPSFTLLEQFAYLFCIRQSSKEIELSPFELPIYIERDREELERSLYDLQQNVSDGHFLKHAKLIDQHSLLLEIWNLIGQADGVYFAAENGNTQIETIRYPEENALEQNLRQRAARLAPVAEFIMECAVQKNSSMLLTPLPLARLMSRMAACGAHDTVWDPACGTGRLLIECLHSMPEELTVYGTDCDAKMIQVAEINLFFHGISRQSAVLSCKNSFEEDTARRKFDVILANPPVVARRDELQTEYPFAVPTKKINLQFLQLIMDALRPNGRAAVLVNENVLFSSQPAEAAIRRRLLDEAGLCGVISLPQGVFAPYTGAKASLLILGGERPDKIFFYRLEQLGYSLNGKRMPVKENDIPDLLEKWERRRELDDAWERAYSGKREVNLYHVSVPKEWKEEKCWFALCDVIRANEYNLTAEMYRMTETNQKETESPEEILQTLEQLETEAADSLRKLADLIRAYR